MTLFIFQILQSTRTELNKIPFRQLPGEFRVAKEKRIASKDFLPHAVISYKKS